MAGGNGAGLINRGRLRMDSMVSAGSLVPVYPHMMKMSKTEFKFKVTAQTELESTSLTSLTSIVNPKLEAVCMRAVQIRFY